MRRLRMLRHRCRSLLRRRTVDEELERELSLHLEQLVREQMDAGLPEADAKRAAARQFGSLPLVAERCRDARRIGLIENFLTDAAYGTRLLMRSPGFAATALLSLAVGIGANTAVFTLIEAVLLRSLPVVRPHELVFLQAVGTEGPSGAPPYPCFERFRAETSAFREMAAFAADELRIEVDGQPEQVFGQVASGTYFDVLGLRPAAGRLMTVADERLDPPVAVLGYGYWQRRFGGRSEAIGRTLSFRDRTYTIVGVTPREFWGLQPGRHVDVTIPITEDLHTADPGSWWFDVIARLRPGFSAQQAAARLDAIFQTFMNGRDQSRELRKKYFDHIELAPAARGLDRLRTRFSRPLHALAFVAALVLIIACANLANLLLVRGAVREHELGIRLATGAGPRRLLAQLLTETLLLFLLGGAAGLAVARLAVAAVTGFFAVGRNPIQLDVHFDWTLAAFAALVAVVAGLLTGLWPAVRAVQTDPHASMKQGDARLAGSRRTGAVARVLVIFQASVSLVLLVASVMFLKTMTSLRQVDLGFSGSHVLTMSIDPVVPDAEAAAARDRFWRAVLDRVSALPGVRAASLSVLTPLSGRDTGMVVNVPGFLARGELERTVHVNHVSSDYFRTFGVRLVAGRTFTPRDSGTAPKVAIVNEAAARFYFAGRNPIGETVGFDGSGYEIVGVVRDYKHMSVRQPAPRFVFVPLAQRLEGISRTTLSIRSEQPPAAMAREVARIVRAVDPDTLVSDVVVVEDQIDATLVTERLLARLATWFAALALGLAVIGLYGVLSYHVARRRAELGVRIALGAAPGRVARDVFRQALIQIGAGTAMGIPIALAVAQVARGLLFGVTPADPGLYVSSAAVLVVSGCIAAWLPARRAASIDPAEALRRE